MTGPIKEARLAESLNQIKWSWWSQWQDDMVTPEEDLAWRKKRLKALERQWQGGLRALAEAKLICHRAGVPLPVWATPAGMKGNSALQPTGKRGRHATDYAVERQQFIDKVRWELVTELLARKDLGLTEEAAFEAAAEISKGHLVEGAAKTMKRAYKRLEKE